MSRAVEILTQLATDISSGDSSTFQANLNKLPVLSFSNEFSLTLLREILISCWNDNQPQLAYQAIEYWESVNPTDDRPFIYDIVADRRIPIEVLKLAMKGNYTPFILLSGMAKLDNSPEVPQVADRIIEILDTLNGEQYLTLAEDASNREAIRLQDWAWNRYLAWAPLAPIPKWMIEHRQLTADEWSQLQNTDPDNIPLPSDAKEPISYDEEELQLDSQALIRAAQGLEYPVLFRYYGPLNPLEGGYGADDSGRMLLCQMYDYDFDIGLPEPWFTGNCWHCGRQISRREYAVRLPDTRGGWKGCFDTWDCVRYFVDEQDPLNTPLQLLIDFFEEQVTEQGIYDRDTLTHEESHSDKPADNEQ